MDPAHISLHHLERLVVAAMGVGTDVLFGCVWPWVAPDRDTINHLSQRAATLAFGTNHVISNTPDAPTPDPHDVRLLTAAVDLIVLRDHPNLVASPNHPAYRAWLRDLLPAAAHHADHDHHPTQTDVDATRLATVHVPDGWQPNLSPDSDAASRPLHDWLRGLGGHASVIVDAHLDDNGPGLDALAQHAARDVRAAEILTGLRDRARPGHDDPNAPPRWPTWPHELTSSSYLDADHRLHPDPAVRAVACLFDSRRSPADQARANDPHPLVRAASRTPQPDDPHPLVRAAAAPHVCSNAAGRRPLLTDPHPFVRAAAYVACPRQGTGPGGLPTDAARLLAREPDPFVRAAAQLTPTGTVDGRYIALARVVVGQQWSQGADLALSLAALSDVVSPDLIRGLLVLAPDPEPAAVKLLAVSDLASRLAVAEATRDPDILAGFVAMLAEAADRDDAKAYLPGPGMLSEIIVANPACPAWLHMAMADHPLLDVRRAVAASPHAPAAALVRLACGHIDVRISVAGNPTCPAEAVSRLAADHDPRVAARVMDVHGVLLDRQDLPAFTLEDLAQRTSDPAVLDAIERCGGRYVTVTRALAASPHASVSLLDRLAMTGDPKTVNAVAAHPRAAGLSHEARAAIGLLHT